MGERKFSRRRFIAATGASLTAAGLATLTVGAQRNNDDSTSSVAGWLTIEVDFTGNLDGVSQTRSTVDPEQQSSLEGNRADSTRTRQTPAPGPSRSPTAVAVGEGGTVLARDEGGSWKTVLDKGPSGENNDLKGFDGNLSFGFSELFSRDDRYGDEPISSSTRQQRRRRRRRVWIVGKRGTVAVYHPRRAKVVDRSKPNGVTQDFTGVAVTSSPRGENVYIASKSGEIVYSFAGGESRTWNSTKITEAPLKAIDFHGPRSGHAIDRTQTVYATTDGTTWTPIGIPYATNTFYGVESRAPNDVTVSAGGGFIWRWNGYRWTPKHTGDDGLRDVERGYSGPNGLACGADGTIQRYDGTWNAEQTPTDETLLGVARATDYQSNQLDIAVGTNGTILERKRSRSSRPG